MFQLIFKGECLPGVDLETARANAKALFKASLEQVDKMFSGQPVIIRNQLEQAQAEKYLAVLAKHGMKAYVQPMAGPTTAKPAAPASTPPAPTPKEPPTPRAPAKPVAGVRVEPGDRPKVAGEKVDEILAGSSLSLDPAGVTLVEATVAEPPMFEHMDDWSIAPPGTDLGVTAEQPPPIVPDTSHLSLADDKHEPDER